MIKYYIFLFYKFKGSTNIDIYLILHLFYHKVTL